MLEKLFISIKGAQSNFVACRGFNVSGAIGIISSSSPPFIILFAGNQYLAVASEFDMSTNQFV